MLLSVFNAHTAHLLDLGLKSDVSLACEGWTWSKIYIDRLPHTTPFPIICYKSVTCYFVVRLIFVVLLTVGTLLLNQKCWVILNACSHSCIQKSSDGYSYNSGQVYYIYRFLNGLALLRELNCHPIIRDKIRFSLPTLDWLAVSNLRYVSY